MYDPKRKTSGVDHLGTHHREHRGNLILARGRAREADDPQRSRGDFDGGADLSMSHAGGLQRLI